MAWLAAAATVWAGVCYVLLARTLPRLLDVLERRYPAPFQPEAIDLPPEIAAYVARFQRKESTDYETAYFREQYHNLGRNWQKVLQANPQVREWELGNR